MPEYRIDLLNKNKKIINKLENIEKIEKSFIKQNFNKKQFGKKKFSNKNRKKFNYHSRSRRNNFENKKTVNY